MKHILIAALSALTLCIACQQAQPSALDVIMSRYSVRSYTGEKVTELYLVNNLTGSGFSDLINGYQIRYAQQLMREHPGMAHGDVAIASGFSSRTAFLRTFKAKTGLSPTEWKANREKSPDGELK